MSAKLKLLLIVVFSFFVTAATGIYITQRQPSAAVPKMNNGQTQYVATMSTSEEIEIDPERANYKSMPLENINSSLQGSDPADLALNAFEDDIELHKGLRKVEVYYPQPNRALVTITQTKPGNNFVIATKYRVELTTFGRSLLVSSPRAWRIIWAGSLKNCGTSVKCKG